MEEAQGKGGKTVKDLHKKFYCIWKIKKKKKKSTLNWEKKIRKKSCLAGTLAAVHSPRLKRRKKVSTALSQRVASQPSFTFHYRNGKLSLLDIKVPKTNFALYQDE